MVELSPGHEKFVQEYMRCFSPKIAAINSGFSPKSADSFLDRPDVKMRIAEIRKERQERYDIEEAEIVQQLMKQAFADVTDFISWDENGVEFIDYEKVDGQVINEIGVTKTSTNKAGEESTKVKKKMKLNDKLKALELLMKYKSMLTQNVNMQGGVSIQIMDDITDDTNKTD
jgi:phage terminase small subunit